MSEWWRPIFQTTVDAFYRGDLAAGLLACEKVLSIEGLPHHTEKRTRQNALYYLPKLGDLAPSSHSRPIEFPVPAGWTRFNPSIAADPDGDGFRMIVRSANITLTPRREYIRNDGGRDIITTNYLMDLAADLSIGNVQPIDDMRFRADPPLFPVTGFEDCRLFHHNSTWWAFAVARDRHPRGIAWPMLLDLRDAQVVREQQLASDTERHEKNWMPIASSPGERPRLIYSCFPTIILAVDPRTGDVVKETSQPAPLIARHFRGGSQAIPFDGGYLAVIHESVVRDDDSLAYAHRWIWFDAEWRLSRLSLPFVLQELGVEFAAGLVQAGNDLILSYGRWDRDAYLATVAAAEVRALLRPAFDPAEIEQELAAEPVPATIHSGVDSAPRSGITPVLTFPGGVDGDIVPVAIERPVIVSTTLAGNSGAIIGDALRSVVEWVDWCLVIDTGISDDTLEITREIAGSKLVLARFPWRNDFAAARNFALEAAAALGADWALTLDSDERIDSQAADVRSLLTASTAPAIRVPKAHGGYAKERFFRLPAQGHWVGPTHEAFIRTTGHAEQCDTIVFTELDKSAEQYRQKAERDIAILSRHVADHPDDPRWFYYLGDSFAGLDRHEEAITAFRQCAGLNGWDEEGAWAMYRAGQSLLRLDRTAEAIQAFAAGMARHAGIAELPWMAAYASWQLGSYPQAVYWARVAITLGAYAGIGATVRREGFRHDPGRWEGPYDVLRFALRRLGDDAGADEAERLFALAKAARLANSGV